MTRGFVRLFVALFLAAATSGVSGTSQDVVISQVYGGGGNSGAPLRNDFVELFNRGSASVSLAGWSIQYASATGTGNFGSNPVTPLSGTLAPGQHYLIQLASGGTNGALLPAADTAGTVNMGATAGKVALVDISTGLACNGGSTSCSTEQLAHIVDLVGWGTANFFEGSGPALATSNSTAAFRNASGCADTDNNESDFSAAAPNPRNTSSPLAPCDDDEPPLESCGDPTTSINTIQGNGLTSALTGTVHAIEGIVVGDYQAAGQFGGYSVQAEDAAVDGDPATSEGIFVFNTSVPVAVGDKVRVRGTVFEFASSGTFLTELTSVANVLVCSTGNSLPTASTVMLPVSATTAWEQYEGMLVTIPQQLTVTDTFTLARFGELALSVGGRLAQPTNVVAPGAPAVARQDLNDRSRIVLDDANNQQNIDPTRYPAGGLSAANTVRVGDTVDGVIGVLDQRFGLYRLQPIGPIVIAPTNPRPGAPGAVGGTVRVAAFNVLNYFNGDGLGGGFPTARGATTPVEFDRQRVKTIAAIRTMDADIVGLMELENDPIGNSAIEDLVSGLNAATAPGSYAFIDTGVVGTDEIRVGLLYKPAVVLPVNAFAILDSTVDPDFIDTKNRPSLAQTFASVANGKRLTVVVNHLKSKGSDCLDVEDPDTGDGQGNCNITRTKAATALAEWLAGDPTAAGDPDFILIGDMNSYAMEDPIAAITNAGYTDLIRDRIGADGYSYVFQGQSGYLDHALASNVLAPRVTGVAEWHINADEPVALDYNVEFKTPNQVTTFYAPDPTRSSDHDPVVVGINLIEPFSWSGFLSPVSEENIVQAGAAVPLKFSLGGNRGLDIFAVDSPSSTQVSCEDVDSSVPFEATVSAGGSSLKYDAVSDTYTYVWKTQKAWAGTCRELVFALADGTSHSVIFAFKK